MNGLGAAFAQLASATEEEGATFPNSDAEDLRNGARYIPSPVTKARRRGLGVKFVQDCSNPSCWYWEFQQKFEGREAGSRFFHYAESSKSTCSECGNDHLEGVLYRLGKTSNLPLIPITPHNLNFFDVRNAVVHWKCINNRQSATTLPLTLPTNA